MKVHSKNASHTKPIKLYNVTNDEQLAKAYAKAGIPYQLNTPKTEIKSKLK